MRITGISVINDMTYYNVCLYPYSHSTDYNEIIPTFAHLRQENGKVYMLYPNAEYYFRRGYGSDSIELLIYDFSLEPGEEFQVGKDEYYTNDAELGYGGIMMSSMLYGTDRGRMKCLSTKTIYDGETLVKQLQLCLSSRIQEYTPELRDTFTIQEGVGFLKWGEKALTGYMPYPYNILEMNVMTAHRYDLLYVCDVEDINDIKEGNYGNVIYRQDGMPENPKEYFDTLAVDEIRADEDVTPMYFNIQGMPVSNPTEGEIYIVKRGSKAIKEVYRR